MNVTEPLVGPTIKESSTSRIKDWATTHKEILANNIQNINKKYYFFYKIIFNDIVLK